ncbi:hypothetical protein D5086_028222 [Populus alba]|uniref:Uncharacterized protein n=1 Tax=Populus alba TaxID=43335 RepID=A0ACC4AXQ5_POPAL
MFAAPNPLPFRKNSRNEDIWTMHSSMLELCSNKNLHHMGSGTGSFLKVLLENFDVLAGPVISLVYPLYASIRAIETKSHVDDKQWLTYWILYSMITLFELTFAKVIEWIPIWPFAKLILTCWLVVPYFSGAAYVYENFVRPFYANPQETINILYVPRKKDIFSKPDDVLSAAEKYIEENGTYAFEKLITKEPFLLVHNVYCFSSLNVIFSATRLLPYPPFNQPITLCCEWFPPAMRLLVWKLAIQPIFGLLLVFRHLGLSCELCRSSSASHGPIPFSSSFDTSFFSTIERGTAAGICNIPGQKGKIESFLSVHLLSRPLKKIAADMEGT